MTYESDYAGFTRYLERVKKKYEEYYNKTKKVVIHTKNGYFKWENTEGGITFTKKYIGERNTEEELMKYWYPYWDMILDNDYKDDVDYLGDDYKNIVKTIGIDGKEVYRKRNLDFLRYKNLMGEKDE